GKSGVEQVRALAAYDPAKSDSAVGRVLGDQRLAQLLAVLKDDNLFWVFAQLQEKSETLVGAEEVLDEVRSALRQDEIHVELASRLRELATQSQRLLSGPEPSEQKTEQVLKRVSAKAVGKGAV